MLKRIVPDYNTEHLTYGYMYGPVPPPSGEGGKKIPIDTWDNLLRLRSEKTTAKTAFELWGLHGKRRDLQKEYLDHWKATISKTGTGRPVDAIISPAAAYPAPPHGYNTYIFFLSLGRYELIAVCFLGYQGLLLHCIVEYAGLYSDHIPRYNR